MSAWPFCDLPPLSYDVIVADPPWDFKNYSPAGTAKGADPHYRVMSLDAIKALPVGLLARGDCLLLLWTCGWAIATGQAQEVARAWGFTPQSEMIWRKLTASGKPRMGTGYRVRTLHEPDEFYGIVTEYTPAAMRRADLFARETRPDFDGWGNEVGKFDAGAERSPQKIA